MKAANQTATVVVDLVAQPSFVLVDGDEAPDADDDELATFSGADVTQPLITVERKSSYTDDTADSSATTKIASTSVSLKLFLL